MPNISPSELRRFQQLFPDQAIVAATSDIGGTTQLRCADGSSIYIGPKGEVR